MEKVVENPFIESKSIPEYLIYEVIDGKPLYRKGYREVLNGTKTKAEIMGSSILQSILISLIQARLMKELNPNQYMILGNELGVHLSLNNNLSTDIAIFEREILKNKNISDKYADFPPEIVIEIDVKLEDNQLSDIDYFQTKTQKLLNFGVKKVVWFTSANRKVLEASQNQIWTIADWDKEVEVLGVHFSLAQLIEAEGFKIGEGDKSD